MAAFAGPMVRIRIPPALSQERTVGGESGAAETSTPAPHLVVVLSRATGLGFVVWPGLISAQELLRLGTSGLVRNFPPPDPLSSQGGR
jgi:hypothetical protein